MTKPRSTTTSSSSSSSATTSTSSSPSASTLSSRYKPYSRYKESGVEWLGEIPELWEVKRLRYATRVNPSKSEIEEVDLDDVVSFLPMENIGENGSLNLEIEKPLESVQQGFTYFREGDVIVAKITPCFENGKGAIAQNLRNEIGFGTTELHVLRPGDDLDRRFLFYLTASLAFRQPGEGWMYGTGGQKRVPDDFVLNFRAALPSLNEQRAIAEFLDRETAKIDHLIAKKERLIELLEEKRSALITHAVTRGLNPDSPLRDSGIEWLGQIPAHWQVVMLKRIAKICYGLGQPPRESPDGLPMIRATDLHSGEITADGLMYVDRADVPWDRNPELQENEIIVVRSGAYTGDSAIVPREFAGAISGYDLVLTVTDADPKFVACALLSRYFLDSQIGLIRLRAAQPHLNAEELGTCVLIRPPIEEQRDIVQHIADAESEMDAVKLKINAAIDQLKEYRAALITAAVTGKIDVRDEMKAAA
jgi:type I restriction enzyme, S subunit